jgi:DNA-binding transcriptional LysR family regulator
MELKQMRQFLVLAETQNFHKAAIRLHMAQPPLSVSIRHLEEEIGARLFDRTSRGLQITLVGKSVLEHARRALFHAEQFRHTANLVTAGNAGSLRIDFVVTSTVRLLPRTIARFHAAHPLVDLHLNESNTDRIMTALREGRTDGGLVRYPVPSDTAMSIVPLERNQYVLALPKGHPKATRARLRLSDLRDEPFILPSRVDASGAYASSLFVFQEAGFMPKIVQQAAQAQTMLALVESGLGLAIVPDIWKDFAQRAVIFKPLVGSAMHKTGLAFACRVADEKVALICNFRDAAIEVA